MTALSKAERDEIAESGIWSDEEVRRLLDTCDVLEQRIAEMPKVECACHPGVRWPAETWGMQCPISKAEKRIAELERDRNEWREANSAALQVIQREADKNKLLAARVEYQRVVLKAVREWDTDEMSHEHVGLGPDVGNKVLFALNATDDEVRAWMARKEQNK
jgi:hypothetical protein